MRTGVVVTLLVSLIVVAGCDAGSSPDWRAERDCGSFDVGELKASPYELQRGDPARRGVLCLLHSHWAEFPARLEFSYRSGGTVMHERYRTRNGVVQVVADQTGRSIPGRRLTKSCTRLGADARLHPLALRCGATHQAVVLDLLASGWAEVPVELEGVGPTIELEPTPFGWVLLDADYGGCCDRSLVVKRLDADNQRWRDTASEPLDGDFFSGVSDMDVVGSRLVAVGSWQEFVVVGNDGSYTDPEPAVWGSADGSRWTRVDPGLSPRPARMQRLVHRGGVMVSVGATYDTSDPEQWSETPALWRSEDGTHWREIAGAVQAFAHPPAIEVTEDGFVLFGTGLDGDVVVSTSTDGFSWDVRSIGEPPLGSEYPVWSLHRVGDDLIALRRDGVGPVGDAPYEA